jgi:hypothetical protein
MQHRTRDLLMRQRNQVINASEKSDSCITMI